MIRLTAITAILLFAGISWYLAPLNPNILALQFAFTPRAFAEVIHAWPPEHLAMYRAHLPFDCLLLIAYGTWGYLVATRSALFRALPAALRRCATWCLPLAAGFDATENTFHWWLTEIPRFGVPLPYALSATCSVLKFALILAFACLALYALARRDD